MSWIADTYSMTHGLCICEIFLSLIGCCSVNTQVTQISILMHVSLVSLLLKVVFMDGDQPLEG